MEWYNGLNVNNKNFREIVRRFDAIIHDVLNPAYINSVRVVKNYEHLAAAQPLSKTIFIDEDYFNGDHEILKPFTWSERLVIVTATILHEIAHLRWSKFDDPREALVPDRHKKNKFALIVANILEDSFVEQALEDMFSYTIKFISPKNACLFSDYFIQDCRNKFDGKKPETEEDADKFISLFSTWKRRDYVHDIVSDFEDTVFKLLKSVKFAQSTSQRKEIVGKILDLLPFVQEKEQHNQKSRSSPSSVEVYNSNSKTLTSKTSKIIKSNCGKSLVVFKDVTSKNYGLIDVEDFSCVSVIENCKGAVRSVRGNPQSSGKKITNLKNYEQGTIFGTQYYEGNNAGVGKPEVIVLVDFSGSMVNTLEGGDGKTTKFNFALSCLAGLYEAFVDAGISVGCYGHSTYIDSEIEHVLKDTLMRHESPVIYTLSDIANPLTKGAFRARLSAVSEKVRQISHGNTDATAIIVVSELFTKKPNDKILIVISDGLPASILPEFDSSRGFKSGRSSDVVYYTQDIIKLVRGNGIKVHSLSIDGKAAKLNDIIYGVNFNSHVFNRKQFVQKIIESLS